MSVATPALETQKDEILGPCSGPHSSGNLKVGVLKFGSSVIESETDYDRVVQEIYRWLRKGYRVIAVVSAMGDTTDRLFEKAYSVNRHPNPEILANVVATGEWVSAAHLGLALDHAGIPARVLDPSSLGLKTVGPALDARCRALDPEPILKQLEAFPVIVAPGFVGAGEAGGLALLGRGGTDLSALFIAASLKAEFCHLVKDVDGLYTEDPARCSDAKRFEEVVYDDVLALEEGIVQHKAVRFAREKQLPFNVGQLLGVRHTLVSSGESIHGEKNCPTTPARILIFGRRDHGQVLSKLLGDFPDLFQVLDDSPALNSRELKLADLDDCQADVVIDVGENPEEGFYLAHWAVQKSMHLVSANTAAVSKHGAKLHELAVQYGCSFLYSGAVGGAVPILEALAGASGSGRLRKLEASLSGTCNFVLERLQKGEILSGAVAAAEQRSLCQSKVELDISGQDSLHKLRICANLGFGLDLEPDEVDFSGVQTHDANWHGIARPNGFVLRYIGSIHLEPDGISASLQPQWLDENHPLASLPEEYNGYVLHFRDGTQKVLRGRGSGSHPIAMAVCADLLTLRDDQS